MEQVQVTNSPINNTELGVSTPYRQTSNLSFADKLRRSMANGGSALGNSVQAAAPFVPGAAVLSNVLSNASANIAPNMPGSTIQMPDTGTGSMFPGLDNPLTANAANFGDASGNMQQTMMSMNMKMLTLQQNFQMMSAHFSTISNMMKSKHDTEKNSISNIR